MKNFDYKKYVKDNPLLKEDRFEDVEHVFSGEDDPELDKWREQRRELMNRASDGIDNLLQTMHDEARALGGDTNGPAIWFDIKDLFREKI